jgi:hypothetical protein
MIRRGIKGMSVPPLTSVVHDVATPQRDVEKEPSRRNALVEGRHARATSGHAAAPPPSSVMNSRRFTSIIGLSPTRLGAGQFAASSACRTAVG